MTTIDFGRLQSVEKTEATRLGITHGFDTSSPSVSEISPSTMHATSNANVPDASPLHKIASADVAVPVKSPPRFVGGDRRSKEVPLRYPIEYDGVTYAAIPLRRPNAAEVRDFFERLSRIEMEEWLQFPIYAHADGTPVPLEVIRFLDPDDADAVQEAAADFLCARLRQLQEVARVNSIPPAPVSTGPISSN